MKLPKWLVTALGIVSTVLNLLGGSGIIPPVVQLRPSTAQPLIGGTTPPPANK